MKSETAVAGVALTSSIIGLMAPEYMMLLWPKDSKRHLRLMQAWSISTMGLGATLLGYSPKRVVACVSLASLPWDLAWGGTMGTTAALINLACASGLMYL